MYLFYSYLKSAVSIIRELIFVTILCNKIFKLLFLFFLRNNFWGIKFTEFCKKKFLSVSVTFRMRLKKGFTRPARDLICTIPKFNFFTGIKFPIFCKLAVY